MKTILIVILGCVVVSFGVVFWVSESPDTAPPVLHEVVESSLQSSSGSSGSVGVDPFWMLVCNEEFEEVESNNSKEYERLVVSSFSSETQRSIGRQIDTHLGHYQAKLNDTLRQRVKGDGGIKI